MLPFQRAVTDGSNSEKYTSLRSSRRLKAFTDSDGAANEVALESTSVKMAWNTALSSADDDAS